MQFPRAWSKRNNDISNDNIPIHGWGSVVSGVSSRKGHVAEERERGRGRLKTGELPGKRGKRQCSITTQPNGSTITAPILPAQLNYCVERPREISGIDIESVAARPASWREFGWMTRMRTRLTKGKKKKKGNFFTRMNLSSQRLEYLIIILYKFERINRSIFYLK